MDIEHWERVVYIQFTDDWHAVGNAVEALACLEERWPECDSASYQRALRNCQAELNEGVNAISAMTSFVVAAMAAGLQYELHADEFGFLEAHIASLAEMMARSERA